MSALRLPSTSDTVAALVDKLWGELSVVPSAEVLAYAASVRDELAELRGLDLDLVWK